MTRDLHQQKNPRLAIEETLASQALVIDVRSPKEFESGHVPGAVNIPLLDDQERHLIGILYKQSGPQAAVDQGYQYFEPKQVQLLGQLQALPKDRPWAVLCARGGMRSQVMAGFIRHSGFEARQVTGGYKAYRSYCLERFAQFDFSQLVVLHGQTGVGKTLVIHHLDNALDLEGYANHRGSMFGGVGLVPHSQKQFEGLLEAQLRAADWGRPVFVEGESRKIGPVSVPSELFAAMQGARCLLLKAPLALRAQRIIAEYIEQQAPHRARIRELISRLYPDLGHARVAELLQWFDAEDFQPCFEAILAEYYDPKYNHSLKHYSFEAELDVLEIESASKLLNQWG
ncbi:MAG: tRNA 2-selenouridine(34) synthase MnmH [bacterium]|nr:tRNA 2-selenouridine(34) synthase MnmH [bacterium]